MLEDADIGISSGAYAGLPLEAALLRIAELAPAAEICSWGRHSLLEPHNAHAVRSMHLPFSVHAPFTHDGLGHRTQSRRRAAVDLHRRHAYAAAELGAFLYVVHPDLQLRRRPWNPTTAVALQRSFEELRIMQEESGMTIAVENMPFTRRSHFTAPGDLDLQGLGLALDIGHAAITGTTLAWLSDPGEQLVHLHLHSNPGHQAGDLHQSLGTGVVDAGPAMAVARAAGASIVIENTSEADVISTLEHLRVRGLLPQPVG